MMFRHSRFPKKFGVAGAAIRSIRPAPLLFQQAVSGASFA